VGLAAAAMAHTRYHAFRPCRSLLCSPPAAQLTEEELLAQLGLRLDEQLEEMQRQVGYDVGAIGFEKSGTR
jgi:hypothetical protein